MCDSQETVRRQSPWVKSSTQLLLDGEYTWFLKQLHSVCLLVAL